MRSILQKSAFLILPREIAEAAISVGDINGRHGARPELTSADMSNALIYCSCAILYQSSL